MIHQGTLLKSTIDKSGLSVDNIAKELGYSKQNIYLLYKKSIIKKDILQKIAEIITIDFKEFGFVDTKSNTTFRADVEEELRATIDKLEKEKDKLYNLLENMSNNYSGLLKQFESLKKCSGVENLRGERALNC